MKTAKKDLILIHGFRGGPLGLKEIKDLLSKDFNVYSPSIPPFGDSKPLVQYTPETYALFIANFIKDNNLEKPFLVGHSMGSIITAATAEKYPELIADKIVLLAPIATRTSRFFSAISPLIGVLPSRMIDYVSTNFLIVPRERNFYRSVLKTVNLCSANYVSRRDVYRATSFSTNYSISDFDFKQKALLVAGAKDRLMPKRKTINLAKKRYFELKIIPKTGHLLNFENPTEVEKAISDFLTQ